MYVKGVGPARAAMLEAKGLHVRSRTCSSTSPFRYEDRSNVKTIAQLAPGEMATVIAEVRIGQARGIQAAQPGPVRSALHRRLARASCWASGSTAGTSPNVLSPGMQRRAVRQGGVRQLHRRAHRCCTRSSRSSPATMTTAMPRCTPAASCPIYEAAGKITTRMFRSVMHRVLRAIDRVHDPLPAHIRRSAQAAGPLDGASATSTSRRRTTTCGC